jgi:uncharacterized membrane protein
MNDIVEVPASQQSLKTIGHISYFMHAVVAVGAVLPGVQASVLLLLIAFFLDMFKRDDARGTWQESHFSWRIRSVLWAGGLYLITAPLWLLLVLPGWIAWAIISLWFLYRIARGWLNLSSNTPMPT